MMFYTFAIDSDLKATEMEKLLLGKIFNKEEMGKCKVYNKEENSFCIDNNYFQIQVRKDELRVARKNEFYNMNLKYFFWIDIYSKNDDWDKMMMVFIGSILKELSGDCILESNGDTPLVIRRNNAVTADDSRLKTTTEYPFEYLDVPFQKRYIEMD